MSVILRRNWLVVAWFILAMLLTVIIHMTATAAERKCTTQKGTVPSISWKIVETTNFRLCGIMESSQLQKVAATCETLRAQAVRRWTGSADTAPWQPKCYVVLHPSRESYLREIKAARTEGSSYLEFWGDQVVKRRVDISADRPAYLTNALPHELTHVVLADHFTIQPIPSWADEGMALLAESLAQQTAHLTTLERCVATQGKYRLAQLFQLDQYPAEDECGMFYGQSVSIVQFLITRATPQKFVQFLQDTTSIGYDGALAKHYDMSNVAELERQWTESLNPEITASDSRSEAGRRRS